MEVRDPWAPTQALRVECLRRVEACSAHHVTTSYAVQHDSDGCTVSGGVRIEACFFHADTGEHHRRSEVLPPRLISPGERGSEACRNYFLGLRCACDKKYGDHEDVLEVCHGVHHSGDNMKRKVNLEVEVDDGMVFWVMNAAVELTKGDPITQSANLYSAIKNFYPLASAYDRKVMKEELVPPLEALLQQQDDGPTKYFLERSLERLGG